MTFARLKELAELDVELRNRDLFEFGSVVNAAMYNPEVLKELNPVRTKELDMDKIPAMLRPVYKD